MRGPGRILCALACIAALGVVLYAAPIDGLEVHYELESDGSDSHSNNRDLTGSGSPSHATGKINNGADLEAGSSQYYSSTDNADVSFGDEALTVAAWIKPESVGSLRHIIAKGDGSNGEYRLNVAADADVGFEAWGASGFSSGNSSVEEGQPVSTGTWYFVMGGHRPDTNVLWVEIDCNGESTTAHSAGIFDGTGAFAVGAYPAFGQHFDGVIDEASVWRADKSGDCETLRDGGDGLQYPWDGGGGGGGTARRLLLLGVGK